MSRSFYVDSLIMKRPIPQTLASTNTVTLPSALRHSLSTSHMLPSHPLPCYPRHSSDILSYCCPLCVHTPSPIVPESSATVPPTAEKSIFSSSVTNLQIRSNDFQKSKPLELNSGHRQAEKESSLDIKKKSISSIGK